MAKFNREFLVPYLQDICTLHLARNRLQRMLQAKEGERYRIQQGSGLQSPQYPAMVEPEGTGCLWFFFVDGVLGVLLLLLLWVNDGFLIFMFLLCAIVATVCGLGLWSEYSGTREENGRRYTNYKNELNQYNQQQQADELARKSRLPGIQAEINALLEQIQRVDTLLQQAYSANVIPGHYRNIYAAVFLYQFFSESMSDDLDQVLQMFVLEEIKDRLDRIIANQEEMILQQRFMVANQRASLEEQRRHAAKMESKMEHLALSAEEQDRYLRMIETNTATTAWLAKIDFFRH